MAAPHVAGVAALILSRQDMRPGQVNALLNGSADRQPCPISLPAGYDAFKRPSGDPQNCQGGRAITHGTGTDRLMRSTQSSRQVIERTRISRKTEIREERLLKKSIGSLFSFYLNEADEKERFKPLNELKQGSRSLWPKLWSDATTNYLHGKQCTSLKTLQNILLRGQGFDPPRLRQIIRNLTASIMGPGTHYVTLTGQSVCGIRRIE
jgi:hypothetical protein